MADEAQGSRLLTLEEARQHILGDVEPLPAEEVTIRAALGRVLATDVRALLSLPPWDNSAMDGFALRSADVLEASTAEPVRLAVVGEAAAGHAPTAAVEKGTAVRILTGGMLPLGADAVVAVEDTDAPAGIADLPANVSIRASAEAGRHIRRVGSDMAEGDTVLTAGARLTPAALAVLAASGHAGALVHGQPRVAVLATGDELVGVGRPLGPWSIIDSNSESVAAQASVAGAHVIRLGIARDDRHEVRARLQEGIATADIVVASGGVSVGAHDVVRGAFEEVGDLEIWRVAIQPGKPLAFGRARRPDGAWCYLFGLPGNPVSSFVTFELFVRPLIRRLRGERDLVGRLSVRARLAEPVQTSLERRTFLRVHVEPEGGSGSGYRAVTAGGQGSHVLSALAAANGLAVVPEGVARLPKGAEVEVIRLDVEMG